MNNIKEKGLIYVPWVSIHNSTSINGETVWYRNKFKNFLLKFKRFFSKPKDTSYQKIIVNPKYYQEIKISNNEKNI